MFLTMLKSLVFGGFNLDMLKKLILPLILVIGIPLAGFLVHQKYQNLKLENQKLSLEIVKLQGEITRLAKVNKDNAEELTKFQSSCNASIEELANLYETKRKADKKESDRQKRRIEQEKKALELTKIDDFGNKIPLTDEERKDMLSIIRIDYLFEAYNSTEVIK